MTDPLSILSTLSGADWTALAAFVGLGAYTSVFTKFITHFRASKWDHPTAMARFAVTAVSLLTAASQYILKPGTGSTAHILTLVIEHAAFILTAAHLWYWLSVQPLYTSFLGLLEDAAKWRAATKPQPTAAAAGVVQPEQIQV